MDKEILFSEKQKFSQWWLWLILIAVNGLILFGIFKQIIAGQRFGDKPMSNFGLVITEAFILTLTILFVNFRLETLIKKDGVYVRFFPFQFRSNIMVGTKYQNHLSDNTIQFLNMVVGV